MALGWRGAAPTTEETLRGTGPAEEQSAWRDRDILTGRRVQIRKEGEPYEGWVLEVGREGRLVVEDDRETLHQVLAGEIRLLG